MYQIKACSKTNSTLTVAENSPFFNGLDKEKNKVIIKFGIKTFNVKINISEISSDNRKNISLSNNVINYLGIPSNCDYDIFIKDSQLVIGPFIGILSEASDKRLAKMVPTLNSFVKGYKYIGGAIIVFSLEGIRGDEQTVSGFLYQPDKGTWVSGTFPYPATLMSILEASLTSKWEEFHERMQHFTSVLGTKVFNYPHFSKWEMYNLLYPKLGEALPETTLYKEPNDVKEMLQRYSSVYIKPLNGRLAKNIFKVIKTKKEIVIQYGKRRKKQIEYFTNDYDITKFFQAHLIPEMYLIQQTIPLMFHKNRVIDFRVMMVKNENGSWENIGIFSRYGAKGEIVSNITSGGYTEMADNTLQKVWSLTEEEIIKIRAEIESVVRESLQIFEQDGFHFGNIGFDIGIDENGSIYIIEINHQNPDPYIALKAKNRKIYYLARLKNMLYSKYLQNMN